jgi:hypothetical protein
MPLHEQTCRHSRAGGNPAVASECNKLHGITGELFKNNIGFSPQHNFSAAGNIFSIGE